MKDRPCILECDSPSHPPEEDEYWQCGCRNCIKHIVEIKTKNIQNKLNKAYELIERETSHSILK